MQSDTGTDNQMSSGQDGQTQQSAPQQGGERQDWLDKGIEGAGKKAGVNVSNQNADKAGDFANKELRQKEGFGLPGVQ
ncbi:hypothetical protein BD309DRAFT_1021453 [Dichomitus squalens]|uniref:Uncharacterized protein n=1 Tax=Dichomitus squalens TaxID=114155 RepID=A0A4Q9M4E7_9APHY|nr:hypothetical protein BD311DRAFT_869759 [Dichomitus squalens]TBU40390.1 hypothetical protein BD309DRAFT_1021453 [Dichomitus squalens]